ncbi:MAG: helix-turn-helix domain containing protein [Gilliamella sp.]|uniref:helix-turn-helix transcriptional regulator n=1 Tax=Gilliamella sp. TaxID=1891236 RepID=UPI0025ED1F2D|nr:helix-turn-helix transcriptional regulator [Gilliamella sp.]MCO6549549.1 helix-turn-helix domain containing protein [Gilliamella sp.]
MNTENVCKKIINRLVFAYGVKTVKSLSERLDTTVSVIGNRVARNTIPYDLIVKCSIDTGANLQWILTGEGEPNIDGIKTEKKSIELSSEALEKLERIAALKSSGAITDDEYQLLKGSIFKAS